MVQRGVTLTVSTVEAARRARFGHSARAMSTPTLRAWLHDGPFTLSMSSGFFGFYVHAGALTALADAGLAPRAVTGSSAGALVTGLYAGGVSLDAMRERLATLRRDDFWDPAPGAGLLRGGRFRAMLDALLPVTDIEHAKVAYAPSVFDLGSRQTTVLRRGSIAGAIHASFALPVLFHPVRLGGRLYSDGGIADRPGLAGVEAGERVLYHHLASRSPWRRAGSPSLKVPRRSGLAAVSIGALPRVNPFALDRGMVAFAMAEKAMRRALDEPVGDGVVCVEAAG
jgi:NTE family protein